MLLVVATVLAIYKPFGLTPSGARELSRTRAEGTRPVGVPPAIDLAWVYVAAAIAFVVLLALVLGHHLAGSAFHH